MEVFHGRPSGPFELFVKERIYLKAVTPKPLIWYQTAFKAFQLAPNWLPST